VPIQKTKRVSLLALGLALGLVVYLFLFSSFALFHAYANDELSDPKGCPIGAWIQQDNGHLPIQIGVALALFVLLLRVTHRQAIPLPIPVILFLTRAPPAFSFC
jgi:hypothetical protein